MHDEGPRVTATMDPSVALTSQPCTFNCDVTERSSFRCFGPAFVTVVLYIVEAELMIEDEDKACTLSRPLCVPCTVCRESLWCCGI